MKKLKALGITSGIGSMLIGAKKAGFEIVGNVEWRKYYHTGTFEKNFPEAFMVEKLEDLDEIPKEIDLVLGHPDCGNWSNLNMKRDKISCPSDIPLFIELIKKIKPKIFAMDNLLKSLGTFSKDWYENLLKDYNIQCEKTSNWKYGNIQRYRNRLFVIGTRKDLNYKFIPSEKENNLTVRDIIGDLPLEDIPEINHIHVDPDSKAPFRSYTDLSKSLSYRELAFYLKNPEKIKPLIKNRICPKQYSNLPNVYKTQVTNPPELGRSGTVRPKIGLVKLDWNHTSPVINGGDFAFHPETAYPLTLRERARIQGCPDDFIFEGTSKGKLLRQTGKFMPVQFCTYLSKQIFNYLDHE